MTERQLGAAAVQEALGISSATFYRWLRDGVLQGKKVGGRWRFAESTVRALLRASAGAGHAEQRGLEEALRLCRERLVDAGATEAEATMMSDEAATEGTAVADLVIARAVRRKATDLHLIPVADGLGVRERVDGELAELDPPLPAQAARELVDEIKRRAGLKEDDQRPQLGRFFAPFAQRQIDVRASTFPTALGESLTLRLLDPASVRLQIRKAGFSPGLLGDILAAVRRPQGVFLVNGPTGAGKTTTLYGLLVELQRPGLKIMTVEDPIELHIDGILQARAGEAMGFQEAMRAMLHNDLDVGMVGELRDAEQIRLLFQMAIPGHLMLSQLHAPDAARALQRLLTLGEVDPRILVENLRGVLDQRLVRRSCRHCRTLRKPDREDAERLLLSATARRRKYAYNQGCERCNHTGALGRVPVGELITMTPELTERIEAGEHAAEVLRAALPRGHRSLKDDLLAKLEAGEVSPPQAAALLES